LKFLYSLSHTSLSNIIIIGLQFIISTFFARSLGPETFGAYSFLLANINIIGIITRIGTNDTILHFYRVGKDNSRLFGTIIVCIIISFIIPYMLTMLIHSGSFFSRFFSNIDIKSFTLAMLIIPVLYIHSIIIRLIQINGHLKSINYLNIILKLLILISFFYFYLFGKTSLQIIFCCLLISHFIVIMLGYFHKSNIFNVDKYKFDADYIIYVFKSGLFVQLSIGASILSEKIIILFCNNYFSLSQIGILSVALQIITLFLFVPITINQIFYSKIKLKKQNLSNINDYTLILLKFTFLFLVIISSFVLIFGPYIINYVYGDQYLQAQKLIPAICIAAIFRSLSKMLVPYFLLNNKVKILCISSLISFVTSLIFSPFFLKLYGIQGAPIILCFSFSFAFFYQIIKFKNMNRIDSYSKLIFIKKDYIAIKKLISF